jgi:tellurite resistance protein TerC
MGGGDAAASVTFPLWAWFVFVGLVVGLLFLDLFVLHRNAKKIPFQESLRFTGLWVAIALAFGGFVWYLAGPEVAGEYLASYLVEWSLSLDNVFVWAVIFSSFAVPEQYRYHVLLWGVMGALVFRAIFVVVGIALLSAFSWLVFVFGAFLIFTGVRMLRRSGDEKEPDAENNRTLKLLRRFFPFTSDYRGDHFFVKSDVGKRCATPLLAVLVIIESSDLVFAIDSVPAVLSITSNTFIAYSAIAFAVLGLRHLYFALEGLRDRFVYLHYGLAAILVFVGAKFLLEGFGVHLPIIASLLPIVAILAISIGASWLSTRGEGGSGGGGDGKPEEDGNGRQSREASGGAGS